MTKFRKNTILNDQLAKLVQDSQNGSREAFGCLVSRYQNLVTSVALARTGDLQLSEDIAQEAFLVAWQKRTTLDEPIRFGGWVRGIALNITRNALRTRAGGGERSTRPIDDHSEPVANIEEPGFETSRLEQSRELWSIVEDIQDGYREVLILYYQEGQSLQSVADQLGLSESAAKQRLKRGREKLKQEIETRVAQMLHDTKPNELFRAGVLAALPSVSSLGGTAVKAGTTAAAKSAVSKTLAASASGPMLGIFGGALGSLLGVAGGWLGIKNSADSASSEEERRLLWQLYKRAIQLAILFVVGVLGLVFFSEGTLQVVGLGALMTTYSVLLVLMILQVRKRRRQLHQVHGVPNHSPHSSDSGLTPITTLRLNALAMIGGSWTWLLVYASVADAPVTRTIMLLGLIMLLLQAWVSAASCRTARCQVLYNGRCFLWSAILQVGVLLLGLCLGEGQFANGWDGVPVWAMCGLVILVGVGVAALTRSRANRLKSDS